MYEDSPDEHTVAVDPEMLGHIFENLLEDNKDKGAFYTPKEIVHYMCRESLIEYLYSKLNPERKESAEEEVLRTAIEKFVLQHEGADIIDYEEPILRALKEVKICDPAIGSGAFPMGLLMEIFYLVETLYYVSPDVTTDIWKLGRNWNPAKVKEQIIQNSIYGVDIEKGAVDIARLRFWLSLVVDETTPKPLPNLDYKIVVGNSLLSKFEDEVIDIDWNIKPKNASAVEKIINDQQSKLVLLSTRQYEYFQAGVDKYKQQIRIRDLKIDILVNQVTLERIAYEENNKIQHSAFPSDKEIKREAAIVERIRDYNRSIHKLETVKKDKDAFLHFFDWKLDFPEVMNEKVRKGIAGFDIIIGNPPYVDIKAIPELDVRLYFEKFETCQNRINLYSIFIEKSLVLLNEYGLLSFIIPNSLLLNSSYSKIREKLLTGIDKLIKLPDAIFEKAIVETIIFQFLNKNHKDIVLGKVYPNDVKTDLREVNFSKFKIINWEEDSEKRFNIFSDPEINKVLSTIEKNTKSLVSLADFSLGITPYDKYKGHSKSQIEGRVFHSPKKISAHHVPLISGKNVLRYIVTNDIEEYLDYGNWLGAPRERRFFLEPRIIVRQILSGKPPRIFAGFTSEELYFTQIGFGVIPKDKTNLKYFVALLNSNLFDFYHKFKFLDTEKQIFQKVLIANCKLFPIKEIISKEEQLLITRLVDKLLKLKQRNTFCDSSEIEKEIDLIIYKIYNLTYEEACVIETNIDWMTKEAYDKFVIA